MELLPAPLSPGGSLLYPASLPETDMTKKASTSRRSKANNGKRENGGGHCGGIFETTSGSDFISRRLDNVYRLLPRLV
jgi:hypothetical protein